MESALSIKGQATIPKPVRDHLGLTPGDRVKFFIHPDRSVVILPKVETAALRGMVSRPGQPVSPAKMDAAAGQAAAAKARRGRSSRGKRR